jgi:protein SCO1/2
MRVAAFAAAALLAAMTAAGVLAFGHSGGSKLTGVQSQLGLFSLSGRPAPRFVLTDQRGDRIDLAALRGRPVVLEFMDPACTDICPIVSQEFVRAARLLGTKARQTEFLAVNVNEYRERVADVRGFSRRHGLDALPTWHFLTGHTAQLKAVWKAYGVAVRPNPDGDVVHSSLLYFIDRNGRERYLAWPDRDKRQIADWSRGIAVVVKAIS